MRRSLGRIFFAVVLSPILIGCKSGPSWDWWRVGKSTPMDSSPIARSAGPPLPSELAQQSGGLTSGSEFDVPSVDPGTDGLASAGAPSGYAANPSVGAYGGASPGSAMGVAASTYPTTGSPPVGASPVTMTPPAISSGLDGHSALASGTPRNTGGQAQQGMYDATAYPAPSTPNTPVGETGGSDRYAMGSGSSLPPGGAPPVSYGTTPWQPDAAPGATSAASTYPRTSGAPFAIGQGQAATTPTEFAPPPAPANAGSADIGAGGNRYATTGIAPGTVYPTTSAPPMPAISPVSPIQQTAGVTPTVVTTTEPPRYRPGGTGDYTGLGADVPVSVASRPPVAGESQAWPPAANAAGGNGLPPNGQPGLPGGSFSPPARQEIGSGNRY